MKGQKEDLRPKTPAVYQRSRSTQLTISEREELRRLRVENAYLKKLKALAQEKFQIGTKEKVIIINELRQCHPLSQLLVIADLPRSTFYYHVKRLNAPIHINLLNK